MRIHSKTESSRLAILGLRTSYNTIFLIDRQVKRKNVRRRNNPLTRNLRFSGVDRGANKVARLKHWRNRGSLLSQRAYRRRSLNCESKYRIRACEIRSTVRPRRKGRGKRHSFHGITKRFSCILPPPLPSVTTSTTFALYTPCIRRPPVDDFTTHKPKLASGRPAN